MEKLNQKYISNLVLEAQAGDSNAFAELYAALYERHFHYLSYMLEDVKEIEATLEEGYIQILHGLSTLAPADLYLPWSCRLFYRHLSAAKDEHFADRIVATPEGNYSISQLLSLPLTESQLMIMHYVQKLPVKEIGEIFNFDNGQVKLALKSGIRHLQRTNGKNSGKEKGHVTETAPLKRLCRERPDAVRKTEILAEVFEACGRKANTIPLSALSEYAVYRKERFSLQRGILIAAMILFLLLPLLFLLPKYEVGHAASGVRSLPVYAIHVDSLLPVHRVLAQINRHNLPVYEAGAKDFTVEPTRNGTLQIKVELINRQSVTQDVDVTEVDAESPKLIGSEVRDGKVYLNVNDSGIGVDYHDIYAQGKSGEVVYPESFDAESGEIVFIYPKEEWDVYIPDYIGNIMHLQFTFRS